MDGVSLRQISTEAGSGNTSAVHYHFGTKQGLIDAILQNRIPYLMERRRLLAARADPDDLRSVLEAHLLPILEIAESGDCHYMTFLEQLLRRYPLDRYWGQLPDPMRASYNDLLDAAGRLVKIKDPDLRRSRIDQASLICIHAAAERERQIAEAAPAATYNLFVSNLFDGIIGYLEAPVSPATQRALKGSRPK